MFLWKLFKPQPPVLFHRWKVIESMDAAKLCRFKSSESLILCILDFSDHLNKKLAMEDAMPMEEAGKFLLCRVLCADVSLLSMTV